MRMRKIPLTLTLTLIVGSAVIICQAEEEKRLWCDTNAIAKLHEGNVTCSFPMDLRDDDIVGIRHYTDTSDKLIMDCRWDKLPDQCNSLRPPYKVIKVTGRTLKLKVSNISVPHLTTYRCSLWDGKDMYHSPFCAMLIHPDPFAVTSGGLTSTAANLDQPSKRQDSKEGLSGGVVAGYVICAVIIVVLTAVVVLCYRDRSGAIFASCRDRGPGCLNRRGTHATNSASIEELNEERAEDPMLPGNSAGGQNRPPPLSPRPSPENQTEAGTSEGSNAGNTEERTLPGNSDECPDRRGTYATNSATIELNEDRAEDPMLPVNSAGGQNSSGNPTKKRPSTEKDVMGKAEREPLNGDTASSGFPPPYSYSRSDDKAKGGGG